MSILRKFFSSLWPFRLIIGTLIIIELLGGLGLLWFQTEYTWKGLIMQSVATLVGFELLSFITKRKKISYAVGPAALLFSFVVAADAIGDMSYFYGTYIAYDQWMHFFGGFATVFIFTGLFYAIHRKKRGLQIPRYEIFLYGLSVGTLGSVLYEIEEYLEDYFTGSNRLGDGFDTANDLGLAVLGGAIAAFIVLKFPKLAFIKKSPNK